MPLILLQDTCMYICSLKKNTLLLVLWYMCSLTTAYNLSPDCKLANRINTNFKNQQQFIQFKRTFNKCIESTSYIAK